MMTKQKRVKNYEARQVQPAGSSLFFYAVAAMRPAPNLRDRAQWEW